MTVLVPDNSPEAVQARLSTGRIPRFGPMLMLVARPALCLLAQGIAILVLMLFNDKSPAISVRNWWTVYATLVDFGCLGLLAWLTHREGIRLRDLVGFMKSKLKTDILLGLGIFIIIFPITMFGGGMLSMLIAYGSLSPAFPEFTYTRVLPLLAVLYSRIIWWPVWSFTEELTYDGYALPRLKAITRSPWLSVALVGFFWAIQHSFLPLVNFQHGLYLFLTFVPLTIALQIIYLRVRRLTPLIVGHWLMDLFSVLFLLQIG